MAGSLHWLSWLNRDEDRWSNLRSGKSCGWMNYRPATMLRIDVGMHRAAFRWVARRHRYWHDHPTWSDRLGVGHQSALLDRRGGDFVRSGRLVAAVTTRPGQCQNRSPIRSNG